MKAAVIRQFGAADVLSYENVETPEPRPGHLLIKVLAAGINRLEHYLREGSVVPELPFPHILGADAVGEVAALGEGVTGFALGERVIPMSGYPASEADAETTPIASAPSFGVTGLHRPGTYAQFLEVPARWVLKDDTGLPAEQVATLPMVVPTAVRAVKVVGEVKAGDKVLVTAGSSGTGSMAIQVAKALGAEVATTVRGTSKVPFLKDLGADLIIDTQAEDFVARVHDWTGGRGVDVAIDNLGGDSLSKAIEATAPLGIVVAMGFMAGVESTFDVRGFFFAQKQIRGTLLGDLADFRWGLEQVRAGRIKPLLDRALPLKDAALAHHLVAENKLSGNIVLLPWAA